MITLNDYKEIKMWMRGRDSWTQFTQRHGNKTTLKRLKAVTDLYPLWPYAGYHLMPVPVYLKNAFNMAYREPGRVIEAWGVALANSGRMVDAIPCDKTLLLVSDGLGDKSGLYHFGVRFAEDLDTMSRNSQRDILVGKLSEKNALHMIQVGGVCRVTYEWALSRGYHPIWLSDWESLRAVAAGFRYIPGGQVYGEVNKGMALCMGLPWVFHGSANVRLRVTCHGAAPNLPALPSAEVVPVAPRLQQGSLDCQRHG